MIWEAEFSINARDRWAQLLTILADRDGADWPRLEFRIRTRLPPSPTIMEPTGTEWKIQLRKCTDITLHMKCQRKYTSEV